MDIPSGPSYVGSMRPIRIAALALTASFLVLLAAPAAGFPGSNGDIVYQRFYKGGSEIFSIDPAGGEPDRLTSKKIKSGDGIAAGSPAYSPNGRRIVFANAVKRPGPGARRNNLFTMRADGSRPRRLTRSDRHQFAPAFTPDGRRVAYTEGPDIRTIGLDGTGGVNLTAALPGFASTPAFSPDGSSIAFGYGSGDSDIWVMGADGSAPTNLTETSEDSDYQPVFSPDGRRIAFISTRVDFEGDLYLMDADGANPQAIYTAPPGVEVRDPAFSPDGTRIVFSSRRSSRAGLDVFSLDLASGVATAVPGIRGTAYNPDWGVLTP